MRWAGHVARMEKGRSAFKILTGKSTGKRPLEGLGVDGRTILEWTLKRYQCGELGWFGSGKELLKSPCECDIEPPGSISHGVNKLVNYFIKHKDKFYKAI